MFTIFYYRFLFLFFYSTFYIFSISTVFYLLLSWVGDGQGSLVCCSPWGRKERLNWIVLFNLVISRSLLYTFCIHYFFHSPTGNHQMSLYVNNITFRKPWCFYTSVLKRKSEQIFCVSLFILCLYLRSLKLKSLSRRGQEEHHSFTQKWL